MSPPLWATSQERVPLQYLTATAHWRRYLLSVGPGVLVPRPETEIFPDIVQRAIQARPHLAHVRATPIPTGEGRLLCVCACHASPTGKGGLLCVRVRVPCQSYRQGWAVACVRVPCQSHCGGRLICV